MKFLDNKAVLARRFRFLPDRLFAIVVHALYQHEITTLREPKTFTELLAARNASGADPLVTLTADKYTARRYIARRAGDEHLVPLQQVVERAEDLDFDKLTLPCVIKATHGYDMNMFLKRDEHINKERVRRTVHRWLSTDFHGSWKERSYRGLTPRCMVEDFLGDGTEPPTDFKFYVFNGNVGLIEVSEKGEFANPTRRTDKFVNHRINILDADFNPVKVVGIYPPPPTVPDRPDNLDEMIKIAEVLADEFEFVRIDLYAVDGRIYAGEITHYPGGGLLRWRPEGFDQALGELWRNGTPLPKRFRASA